MLRYNGCLLYITLHWWTWQEAKRLFLPPFHIISKFWIIISFKFSFSFVFCPNQIGDFGEFKSHGGLPGGTSPEISGLDEQTWDMVGGPEPIDDSHQQLQIQSLTGGELIRLLLQLQAKTRKEQPSAPMERLGTGYQPILKTNSRTATGYSGPRAKKRQILYRQCFFNPISCF